MRSKLARRCGVALSIALLLALSGCTLTPPTRFYTLSGVAAPPSAAGIAAGQTIGVGPVTLPDYLDRPQIVTRSNANTVRIADFDSWVSPLTTMFQRVLVDNLALLLGTDDLVSLPQRRAVRLAYQVEVDVNRFDADATGRAVLDARWYVYGRDGDQLVQRGRSTITEATAGAGDYEAIAAAMSRALGAMSEEIAEAILAAPN